MIFLYSNYIGYYNIDKGNWPVEKLIKYNKKVTSIRQFVINVYTLLNIFLTPFLENFFAVFIILSLIFAVEATLTNIIYGEKWWSLILVP